MSESRFDPAQHLSNIKGQEYLEVKWRLAWLRAEHPDAKIVTELKSHENDRAIFYAYVEIPEGGSATGWGSVTASEFDRYLEKAETTAIGRALAALGFGTQFSRDFDDGPETGMLADAPVGPSSGGSGGYAPREPAPIRSPSGTYSGGQRRDPSGGGHDLNPGGCTKAQTGAIYAIRKRLNMDENEVANMIHEMFDGKDDPTQLTKAEASSLIKHLDAL